MDTIIFCRVIAIAFTVAMCIRAAYCFQECIHFEELQDRDENGRFTGGVSIWMILSDGHMVTMFGVVFPVIVGLFMNVCAWVMM